MTAAGTHAKAVEAQKLIIAVVGHETARQSVLHMLVRDFLVVAMSEDDADTRCRELEEAVDRASKHLAIISANGVRT